MKRILYIACILYFASACDVLDVNPTASIPAASAFKNKAGIEKGILGSYDALQPLSYYGRAYLIFSDLAADNLVHPPDATSADVAQVDNNAILPENGFVSDMWASIYNAINVANNVIVKVPEMTDMTDAEKNAALGELYFLRALDHFNLVNYFGAIPLKTKPTVGVSDLDAGRTPVSEVYQQIIADLTFAEANLNTSSSLKIRATRFAATALLARIALYEGNYDLAWQKADDVINNGGYVILDNYADIFASDASQESIFEVDYTEVDRNRVAEYNFPKSLNGRREVAPAQGLIDSYEAGDARKDVSIAYDGNNAYANKYNDLSKGADNLIVLRLAEMYLIRAEAEAHKASPDLQAIRDDINVIRTRAQLNPTAVNNVTDLLSLIEVERRSEFAFEGQRWFDLVRTGRATEVLPTVTNADKTLFPVPSSELQTNNSPEMIQNPGY
jgi:starch-binding outer membrane protein, SusD/RagB family